METTKQTMNLHYTGPVKKAFGLTLKSGSRIMVQPGQPLTVSVTDSCEKESGFPNDSMKRAAWGAVAVSAPASRASAS